MSAAARDYTNDPRFSTDESDDLSIEVSRLRTENSNLREVVGKQRTIIATLKAEQQAHKALRDNPNLTPLRKDTLEVVYEMLGCPLGTSPATRPYPDTIISHEKIAQRLGVSAKQIGKHLADMEMDGWVKRALATGINPENGKPVKHYHYAPVEGQAFLTSVGAPDKLVEHRAPGTSTLKADAEKSAARRRLIEARCPVCKTTDCTIHCSNGHTTHMDNVEDAQPQRALSIVRNVRETDEDPVREESSLTQNDPGVREDSSGNYLFSEGTCSGEETSLPLDEDPVREESSLTLQDAVATLSPAVTRHHDAVRMRGGKPKYLSIGHPLTEADVAAHLRGEQTFGAGLLYETPDGARVQALVWDEDGRFDRLARAATRLNNAGLRPLLVRNPIDPQRGHLWLLFTAPCDPAWAIAAAERIAPELRTVEERFPDLNEKGGARVRLPGGAYVTGDGRRIPTQVAAGMKDGPGEWLDGTTPDAWALIGVALSDPEILGSTFVPREERPRAQWRPKPGVTIRAPRSGDDFFDLFNADNPIEGLVEIGRDRKFVAPWRNEDTPSVHVYDDGHWHDFGPHGRHGLDAFDLWCALNGYWNEATNRPDRKAARVALKGDGGHESTASSSPVAEAEASLPVEMAFTSTVASPSPVAAPGSKPTDRCQTCKTENPRWSERWNEWQCATCYPAPVKNATGLLHIASDSTIEQEVQHGRSC